MNSANHPRLFLVEGLLTCTIGCSSIFLMVPSLTQTASWPRMKSWFNEREEKIAVNRILRDDPSKGTMNNRESITLKMLWRALCDYNLWPLYAIALMFDVPSSPAEQYLTLSLRGMDFSTLHSNLLSIPGAVSASLLVSDTYSRCHESKI